MKHFSKYCRIIFRNKNVPGPKYVIMTNQFFQYLNSSLLFEKKKCFWNHLCTTLRPRFPFYSVRHPVESWKCEKCSMGDSLGFWSQNLAVSLDLRFELWRHYARNKWVLWVVGPLCELWGQHRSRKACRRKMSKGVKGYVYRRSKSANQRNSRRLEH